MKKKIAYLSTAWFADVDFCFMQEAQKKMDITYILMYNVGGNATVVNIKNPPQKTGLFPASIYTELKEYNKFIDLDKAYVLNINSTKSLSVATFYAYLRLFIFLIKKQFDIIHITKAFDYFALYFYFLGKKMVYSVHDPIEHSSDRKGRAILLKKMAIRSINNLIIFNESQLKEFRVFYNIGTNKRILISRLSVYSCLNQHKRERIINEDYMLFFGSINKYKGLQYLFEAMESFVKVKPNVKLIVAGKGKISFDVNRYKTNDSVILMNHFVPDDVLSSLIEHSKFVIAPYVDATQSGVVMSAFAFCKPCIVTNVGGLPEMVRHEKYGLVVSPRDSESLCKNMLKMIESPHLIEEYSINICKDYQEGNKSWKSIANEIDDFYNKI